MDDARAFETQLDRVLQEAAGPSRQTDVAAVVRAVITTSPSRRSQSVFSALKFVVASAIVALVGGFLLVGVLTRPSADQVPAVGASASPEAEVTEGPDQSVPADLLPGVDLETEEVEPGVFRVVSDGFRVLAWLPRPRPGQDGPDTGTIVAGVDGSVWSFRADEFFRLGDAETYAYSGPLREAPFIALADIEVGLDGRVWDGSGPPRAFDGTEWTVHRPPRSLGGLLDMEVQADGTVWATWGATVGRFDGARWEALDEAPYDKYIQTWAARPMMVGGDTEVWLPNKNGAELYRHDGSGWQVVPTPTDASFDGPGRLMQTSMAAGGTLWVGLHPACETDRRPSERWDAVCGDLVTATLARYDGADWVIYDEADGVPLTGENRRHGYLGISSSFQAAPDGSVWFGPVGERHEPGDALVYQCDGLANFDGQVLRRYLPGMCIHTLDLAPDGTVWLQAGRWHPGAQPEAIHIYAITPGSLATTE